MFMDTFFLGKKIRDAREEIGLTQEDLATILNITRQSVQSWEKGKAAPFRNKWAALENALKKQPGWIATLQALAISDTTNLKRETGSGWLQDKPADSHLTPPTGIKPFTEKDGTVFDDGKEPVIIPVIGTVMGGQWTEVYDRLANGDVEEWALASAKLSKSAFALRVDGDSMEPEFHVGDLIAIDPEVQPVHGDFVVAKIPKEDSPGDEGEATFKQLIFDGPKTYLKALNRDYDKLDVTGKRFRFVGVVKERLGKQY